MSNINWILCAIAGLGVAMATPAMAQAPGNGRKLPRAHTILGPIIATPMSFDLTRPALLLTALPALAPARPTALVRRDAVVAGISSSSAHAIAAAFAPGYIPGPAYAVQPITRGPIVEVGALGGGMDNTPFLAHFAMDWKY